MCTVMEHTWKNTFFIIIFPAKKEISAGKKTQYNTTLLKTYKSVNKFVSFSAIKPVCTVKVTIPQFLDSGFRKCVPDHPYCATGASLLQPATLLLGRIRPLLSCRYTEVVLATRYRGCWYYLYYFLLLFAVLSCYVDSRSHLYPLYHHSVRTT